MASNLLNIVHQESKPNDEEKLKFICSKYNSSNHFKISREQFVSLSESDQMKMLTKFYNQLEPDFFGQDPSTSVDSSISKNIKNSSKLKMTKVIENSNGRAELAITADKEQEKKE